MTRNSTGLIETVYDGHEINRADVLGSVPLKALPDGDFLPVPPTEIKDQNGYDFCAGFSLSSCVESHEGIEIDPFFSQMAGYKKVGGDEWKKWGIALKNIAGGAIEFGCLDKNDFPFPADTTDRDQLANPANWPEDSFMLAAEHRQNSYTWVHTGPYDVFDNIRAQIFAKKDVVQAGIRWRHSWDTLADGIIPKDGYEPNYEGHAIKIWGQKLITLPDGTKEIMLVVQNSWGKSVGQDGYFFLPREVVNREIAGFGAIMYEDLPKDYLRFHQDHHLKISDSSLRKFFVVAWSWIVALPSRLINKIRS